jgi:hypothetical protein
MVRECSIIHLFPPQAIKILKPPHNFPRELSRSRKIMAVVSSSSSGPNPQRHHTERRRRPSLSSLFTSGKQGSGSGAAHFDENLKPKTDAEESQSGDTTTLSLSTSSRYASKLKPSSAQAASPAMKKKVRFHSILIREHSRDVDVNPSVSSGPAVGLGWSFRDHPAYDLIDFEENRPPRRTRAEFQLPRNIREKILEELGVSRHEVVAAIRSINVARRQRQASLAGQEVEGAYLAMEWVSGKMKKMIGKKAAYAKEEQKLWIAAQNYVVEKETMEGSLTARQ